MNPKSSTSPHPVHPASSSEPSNSHIRRHGKIARLPSDLRELVNVMLHEGAPYASIIKTLRQHGQHLNAFYPPISGGNFIKMPIYLRFLRCFYIAHVAIQYALHA
jgi:hypothetical protein